MHRPLAGIAGEFSRYSEPVLPITVNLFIKTFSVEVLLTIAESFVHGRPAASPMFLFVISPEDTGGFLPFRSFDLVALEVSNAADDADIAPMNSERRYTAICQA